MAHDATPAQQAVLEALASGCRTGARVGIAGSLPDGMAEHCAAQGVDQMTAWNALQSLQVRMPDGTVQVHCPCALCATDRAAYQAQQNKE